jgi:hypothetical protein
LHNIGISKANNMRKEELSLKDLPYTFYKLIVLL